MRIQVTLQNGTSGVFTVPDGMSPDEAYKAILANPNIPTDVAIASIKKLPDSAKEIAQKQAELRAQQQMAQSGQGSVSPERQREGIKADYARGMAEVNRQRKLYPDNLAETLFPRLSNSDGSMLGQIKGTTLDALSIPGRGYARVLTGEPVTQVDDRGFVGGVLSDPALPVSMLGAGAGVKATGLLAKYGLPTLAKSTLGKVVAGSLGASIPGTYTEEVQAAPGLTVPLSDMAEGTAFGLGTDLATAGIGHYAAPVIKRRIAAPIANKLRTAAENLSGWRDAKGVALSASENVRGLLQPGAKSEAISRATGLLEKRGRFSMRKPTINAFRSIVNDLPPDSWERSTVFKLIKNPNMKLSAEDTMRLLGSLEDQVASMPVTAVQSERAFGIRNSLEKLKKDISGALAAGVSENPSEQTKLRAARYLDEASKIRSERRSLSGILNEQGSK